MCALELSGEGSNPETAAFTTITHYGVTMKTISATDLRVKFTDILKDLDSGPVHITKHGKVIAVLNAPNSVLDAPVGSDPIVDPYEAYEPSESDLNAASDDYEEEDDDWDLSMDSDFERYLSRQMPMDRPLY